MRRGVGSVAKSIRVRTECHGFDLIEVVNLTVTYPQKKHPPWSLVKYKNAQGN